MGIPVDEYNRYKERIKDIYYNGNKAQMEAVYDEIISKYGLCDDLYDLDHYQTHWTILPKR